MEVLASLSVPASLGHLQLTGKLHQSHAWSPQWVHPAVAVSVDIFWVGYFFSFHSQSHPGPHHLSFVHGFSGCFGHPFFSASGP